MHYLIIFFMFSLAHANEICPAPATRVEIESGGGKKQTCAYIKDGQIIKHGEELVLDSAGNILSRTNYVHGNKSAAAANLPAVEEAPKAKEVDQVALEDLTEILRVLTLQKAGDERSFKVGGCDKDITKWIMAAVMKQPLARSYKFDEVCDVQGSFTASFVKEFPMTLKLRNLREFNSTTMKIKMTMDLNRGSSVRYRFVVGEGQVSSPKNKVDFKAEYEVEFDSRTRKFMLDTQKGTLTLLKVNGQAANMTRDLKFHQ